MTKHNLLINWTLIYIILFCLCFSLFVSIQVARIKIAMLLLIILISLVFYPIYIVDKRRSEKYNMKQKKAKVKEIESKEIEIEKKGESIIIEQDVKAEILNLNNKKDEEIQSNPKFYCKFCGKKIDVDIETCPNCKTRL